MGFILILPAMDSHLGPVAKIGSFYQIGLKTIIKYLYLALALDILILG